MKDLPKSKPMGRSLGNFLISGSLPPGEQALMKASRYGRVYQCGDQRPSSRPSETLRADFVRFLMLGGDDQAPVHEKGVQIEGGWIEGLLDLDECVAVRSAVFESCVFDAGIRLSDATLINFMLEGCEVRTLNMWRLQWAKQGWAIFADRVKVQQAMLIRAGSQVTGQLRMEAADIRGDLDLSGSEFASDQDGAGTAIDLIGAKIGGDLELNNFWPGRGLPALVPRPARLTPYVLGGGRASRRGGPVAPQGRQANADEVMRFRAEGRILLDGAQIGMRLRLIGPRIVNCVASPDAALSCIGMTVAGGFFIYDTDEIEGVNLLGAQVGVLIDEAGAWTKGKDRNRFDGFVYGRIAAESRDVDRVQWLDTQRPQDLGKRSEHPSERNRSGQGLRPQPWMQAAKALDGVGEFAAATTVRVAFERRVSAQSPAYVRLFRLGWYLLNGFGYVTVRLAAITCFVWLFGAWCAFGLAGQKGGVWPEIKDQIKADKVSTCMEAENAAPSAWRFISGYWCPRDAPEAQPFIPLLYSADTLVPGLDLRQRKAWSYTLTDWKGWFLLFETVYGYLAATALIAVLGTYIVRKPA